MTFLSWKWMRLLLILKRTISLSMVLLFDCNLLQNKKCKKKNAIVRQNVILCNCLTLSLSGVFIVEYSRTSTLSIDIYDCNLILSWCWLWSTFIKATKRQIEEDTLEIKSSYALTLADQGLSLWHSVFRITISIRCKMEMGLSCSVKQFFSSTLKIILSRKMSFEEWFIRDI